MIDKLLNSQGEDRILLLSGGPKSHLAQRSMFAKGMKKTTSYHSAINRTSSESFTTKR